MFGFGKKAKAKKAARSGGGMSAAQASQAFWGNPTNQLDHAVRTNTRSGRGITPGDLDTWGREGYIRR